MTSEERAALQDIRGLAGAGRVDIRNHALERMDERGLDWADVVHALMNAVSCEARPPDRWRVEGVDLDGDSVTVVVVIELAVVVVTVF